MRIDRSTPEKVYISIKQSLLANDIKPYFTCLDATEKNAVTKKNITDLLRLEIWESDDYDQPCCRLLESYNFPTKDLINFYKKTKYNDMNKLINKYVRKLNKDINFTCDISKYCKKVFDSYGFSTELFTDGVIQNIVEKDGIAWSDIVSELDEDDIISVKFIEKKEGWTIKTHVPDRPIDFA